MPKILKAMESLEKPYSKTGLAKLEIKKIPLCFKFFKLSNSNIVFFNY